MSLLRSLLVQMMIQCTDDDSMKHGIGCCYLEAPNVVKTQKQPDSTSEIADHLPILKEADNVDGLHYTLTGENFWIFLCTALGIGFNCMIVNCSNKFCKKQEVYGAVTYQVISWLYLH